MSYNANNGSNIVSKGDSLTTGAGVTFVQVWDYIFANYNGKGWYNTKIAQSGRTLQQLITNSPSTNSLQYVRLNNGLTTLQGAQSDANYAYDPLFAYQFYNIGTNDVLQVTGANTTANFLAEYHAQIDNDIANGWPISKIKLLNIGLIDVALFPTATTVRIASYNAMIAQMAIDYPGLQVIDINTFQGTQSNWTANFTQDGLHWTVAGHALIGAYVAQQVFQSTFKGVKFSLV